MIQLAYRCFILLMMGVPLSGNAQSVSELYAQVNPSVVVIKTTESLPLGGGTTQKVSSEGLGSGVIIAEDGLIMTAAHVVQSSEKLEVEFSNGEIIPAKVTASVPHADVALIKTVWEPKEPVVARLGNSDEAKVGDEIFIIGAPFGLAHSLSVGYISSQHRKNTMSGGFRKMEFFQTDASINPGNSGGPMFNMKGEVIGICSYILSKSGGFEGLGFVASINIAKHLLLDQHPIWTGIDGLFLNPTLAGLLNVPQTGGILVQRVASLSPGDVIGLQGGKYRARLEDQELYLGGDIILSIDGMAIEDENSLDRIQEHLSKISSGTKFYVKILRQGEIVKLSGVKP